MHRLKAKIRKLSNAGATFWSYNEFSEPLHFRDWYVLKTHYT